MRQNGSPGKVRQDRDMLTMREHSAKHLHEIAFCYLGDARNNTARSLLVQQWPIDRLWVIVSDDA